jgi:hypothetical protein
MNISTSKAIVLERSYVANFSDIKLTFGQHCMPDDYECD